MNLFLLKCFAAGIVTLVVSSALWLADQVQSSHQPSNYRMALIAPAQAAAAPSPAASAAQRREVGVR